MPTLPPSFQADRWVPPTDLIDGYRISELLRHTGCADVPQLVARAAAEPDWFYPLVQEFLGTPWLRPYTTVRDVSAGEPQARWFVGGGTNLSWLAVERWADLPHPAVIWEGDDGSSYEVSYRELGRRIRQAAAGLKALGVGRGDVVAMHLPVVPEAIITMLATARIGAIVAPAFSGYGVDPLAERLRLARAKVLVTADGTLRRGRRVEMLAVARDAAALADVEQVVVLDHLGDPLPDDPRLRPWSVLAGDEDGPIEILDSDLPWLLLFTSGSSGRPKGAVHTHGGIGYSLAVDLGLTLDIGPGDRVSWPADMGWLAGPMTGVGPLVLGATAVLFSGVMDHPAPDRTWRFIERHGVTHYGMAPTVARSMAGFGADVIEPFDLSSLRIIASSGEPWTVPAWEWVHRHVGRGLRPIINWSGGTEIGGPILVCYPNQQIPAGRFTSGNLGLLPDVVDAAGAALVGTVGELVLRRSWPNMTQSLWDEPERYLDSYWRQNPGIWTHGDRAVRYPDGTWEVPGRSDDVFNIAGKRVGPTEFETLATEVPGVVAAAAIGVPDDTKGEVAVIVARVTAERRHDPDLPAQVSEHIATRFGKPMRPAAVVVVDELPLTRSGKVHRRILRAWLNGTDPGDISTLDNPDAQLPLLQAWQATREPHSASHP